MIERIDLKNFQCHEERSVRLGPGLNVFLGPTDAGKSAFLRALRWAFLNLPAGSEFVRHGTDKAGVRVKVDGRIIARVKGKTVNEYKLDGGSYKNLGQGGVPEPIRVLVNVGPENFQGQFDPTFWLGLSPGQVAKELNRIVNLDVMDESLADLSSRHRKAVTVREATESRLKEAETEAESLEWVEALEKRFRKWETDRADADKKYKQIGDLSALVASITTIEKQMKDYKVPDLTKAESLDRKATELRTKITDLKRHLVDTETWEGMLCETEKNVKDLEAELRKVKLCPTCKKPL